MGLRNETVAYSADFGALTAAVDGPQLTQSWRRCCDRLRAELGDDIFNSWFGRIELEAVAGGQARLSVPTRFLKSWIDTHYLGHVTAALAAEFGALARILVVVRSSVRGEQPAEGAVCPLPSSVRPRISSAAPVAQEGAAPAARRASAHPAPGVSANALVGSPLDRRLTFSTFQVGRSNQLAFTSAQRVAENLGGRASSFCPLFLHSTVGLGKTHLLQAVAHTAAAQGRSAIYLTAEKFMYGFVAALQAQTSIAFKERLRAIDLLIFDDAQFLQGKSIQAEFGHALNALLDAGREVIVAADRPPNDLEALDERVRSRLSVGLCVEIGALDEPLRMKILEARIAAARAVQPSFQLSPAVLAFVARSIRSNGRDLEGAVNRLLAHATLTGAPLTVEAAEIAIRDLIRAHEPKRVKIEDIQKLVATPLQRVARRHPVVPTHGGGGQAAAGRDVPRQDPDDAIAAGNRPTVRRTRPHDRLARGAQDRGALAHATAPARRTRPAQAHAAGLTFSDCASRHDPRLQDRGDGRVARGRSGRRLRGRGRRPRSTATSTSRPPRRRRRPPPNGLRAAAISRSWPSTPTRSGTALRWEPSRGGALFPHLYGPLPTSAVAVGALAAARAGRPPRLWGPRAVSLTGLFEPLVKRLPPETAHRAAILGLKVAWPTPAPRPAPRLAVQALGLTFPNPLGLAAGFDKNAEVPGAMLRLGFGFVEVGTLTPRPQPGNARPRLFRLREDGAVINRFGFNNDGFDRARERLARRPAGLVGVNVGANKDAADRIADYALGVKTFAALADYLTINVSSPNTPGLRDLQRRDALDALVARAVEARDESASRKPLLVKIAPDLDDGELDDIVGIALARRVDGLIVSNTTIARPATLRSPHRGEAGGLSGRPLFAPSTRLLARARLALGGEVALIGCGGVEDPATALAKIEAGADLVQLYTGLALKGVGVVAEILDGLARAVEERGVASVAALTGARASEWART